MLMKVVLPAPLLPIRPSVWPRWTATEISLAAITAPKAFCRPMVSRSAVIRIFRRRPRRFGPSRAQAQGERAEPSGQEENDQQEEDAERALPSVGEILAGIGAHQFQENGGDEHGGDADIAAQNGEEDELARSRPEGEIGIDMAE